MLLFPDPDSKPRSGEVRGQILDGMECGHEAVLSAVSLQSGTETIKFKHDEQQQLPDTSLDHTFILLHSLLYMYSAD